MKKKDIKKIGVKRIFLPKPHIKTGGEKLVNEI
jgi:hypothetical protein